MYDVIYIKNGIKNNDLFSKKEMIFLFFCSLINKNIEVERIEINEFYS